MAGNKLVVLALAVVALVAMANATRQTTEMNGECRRQIMQGQWPIMCQQYLMDMMRPSRGRHGGHNQAGRIFDECCMQLNMMEPRCQCQVMRMMMDDMMTMQGGMMVPQIMDEAMSLPMMCGFMQESCRSYM